VRAIEFDTDESACQFLGGDQVEPDPQKGSSTVPPGRQKAPAALSRTRTCRSACHIAAFEALGGAPAEILYDRMKTAVLGEADDQGIAYNRKLLDLAAHYRFLPKACPPYRAKTKGKVERPFRYVREDFFLGGSFRNLDDLNAQFRHWLDAVANPHRHATTGRIVLKHFGEEQPYLKALPSTPFNVVLTLDRRVTREGMVSVGGNLYSVPDCTLRRVVEVHALANEIRILEDDKLIAVPSCRNCGAP
jgi:hypothetical protein